MKILVIGAGYVGLVTAACFAEMGHIVFCLDTDKEKIEKLRKNIIPIYEPGLRDLVQKNQKQQRLFFTSSYEQATKETSLYFIAVPTPSKEDGSCNIQYIEAVCKKIAPLIRRYTLIINKSTAPVGTAFFIQNILLEKGLDRSLFEVVSNPEFLKEGSAIQDCMKPDRIILGVENEKAKSIMKELYTPFTLNHDRILFMSIPSAEMTKYAANAMLATRISFMNEMAEICARSGANIKEVRKGIGSDSRIGYSFLYAGIGYGGSCFPKDIRALHAMAKQLGYKATLIEAVEEINEKQKRKLAEQVRRYFAKKGGIKGKTIAIWGVSFKPDTDDVREAPSLAFIQELQKKGAILKIYDPVSMKNAERALKDHTNIHWCKSEKSAAEKADAIALLTEWKQFRFLDFSSIQPCMKGKALFDGRNQYNGSEMKKKGFDYIGIGVK